MKKEPHKRKFNCRFCAKIGDLGRGTTNDRSHLITEHKTNDISTTN